MTECVTPGGVRRIRELLVGELNEGCRLSAGSETPEREERHQDGAQGIVRAHMQTS